MVKRPLPPVPSNGSKRGKNLQGSATPARKTTTFFATTLADLGFDVNGPDGAHLLTVDASRLRSQLKSKLYFDSAGQTAFVDTLLEYLDQGTDTLAAALGPSSRVVGAAAASATSDGEPLLRILLGVEPIQSRLALALLEALPEHAEDSPGVAKALLGAFRWLDTVVDGAALAEKLLELLDVVPPELERELISFLPEIVDDAAHATVVKALHALMDEKPYLGVAILDALSNLHLDDCDLELIRGQVVAKLPSAPVEETPVMVKFLLQTSAGSSALGAVIRELRAGLDFGSGSGSGSATENGAALTLEALKAGIRFRPAIAKGFLRDIGATSLASLHYPIDLWILFVIASIDSRKKAVKSLFRKKIATSLFTKDLLSSALTGHSAALKEYVGVMRYLAEEMLRSPAPIVSEFGSAWYKALFVGFDSPFARQDILASIMTHVGSTSSAEVSAALKLLITLAGDSATGPAMRKVIPLVKGMLDYLFTQPNVHVRLLFKLFTLLAVGTPSAAWLSAVEDANAAAAAVSGVSGVSGASSASVTSTTSASARATPLGRPWESSLRDELYIIIRKHVSNPSAKFKRIGILGGVALLAAYGPYALHERSPQNLEESSLHESLFSGVQREMVILLKMLKSHTASSALAYAFLADELAAIISTDCLPKAIVFYISAELSSVVFEAKFVIDHEPAALPPPAQGLTQEFSLDLLVADGAASEVAISIAPHVLASNPAAREVALALCSEFRLMHVCERNLHNGSMEEVDAILGCPLLIFDTQIVDAFDELSQSAKDAVLHVLFHALNWTRELLNAFSPPSSSPTLATKSKIATRLANMLHLANMLLPLMARHAVGLPVVGRLMELDDESGASGASHGGGAFASSSGKGKGKGKGKGSGSSSGTLGLPPLWAPGSGLCDVLGTVVREFDMAVFTILDYPDFVVFPLTAGDADTAARMGAPLESQPHLLHVLLADLLAKIKRRLPARALDASGAAASSAAHTAGAGHRFGGSSRDWEHAHAFANTDALDLWTFFNHLVRLVPALCTHLERINSFLGSLQASLSGDDDDDDDGSAAMPGLAVDPACAAAMASHLLVQILAVFEALFAYHGLVEPVNTRHLAAILACPASRLSLGPQGAAVSTDPADLAKHAFDYFANLAAQPVSPDVAVPLIHVLQSLVAFAPDAQLPAAVSAIAGGFLKRRWRSGHVLRTAVVVELLGAHVQASPTPVSTVCDLVTVHMAHLVQASEPPPGLPALTMTTLPAFFKAMCSHTVALLAVEPTPPPPEPETVPQRLLRVSHLVACFSVLAKMTKAFPYRAYLTPMLKAGAAFANRMAKHIAFIAPQFLAYTAEVQTITKSMQVSTRILQAICAETKVSDTHKLGRFVPALRKALEVLIFKIKSMLSANQCSAAFWLGNLKHRNVQGQVVSDRMVPDDDDDDDDEDDDDDDNGEDEEEEEDGEDNDSDGGEEDGGASSQEVVL